MTSTERIRDFFEAANLQVYLEISGYELVYVDEFHVSMKSSAVYNWSCKGCPAILTIEPEPWIMSFVVALSRKQVEGILASNASINSEMFKWFMKDVANLIEKEESRGGNFWFIMDNSQVHWSNEWRDFMKKLNIKCITIPPYSPQLNAAEKLIGLIKGRLRKSWLRDKPLNLNLLKEIIDGISTDSWEKFIKSSREET